MLQLDVPLRTLTLQAAAAAGLWLEAPATGRRHGANPGGECENMPEPIQKQQATATAAD